MLKLCEGILRGGFVAGLVAAGLAASACATNEANDEASSATANAPIAEVTTANGTVVSFFEPGPGQIGIGQQLGLGVPPIATGRSAVELYKSLAPGQAVPQALVDAQVRADAARAGKPVVRSAGLAPAQSGGTGTSDFTSGWFQDNHCYETDFDDDGDPIFWHFINCHADPLPTHTISGTHSDIDEFWVSGCANTAHITLRVWVEDDQKLGVQLNSGSCYTYHWWSGIFNADSFKSSATVTDDGNYGLAVKWNN